MAGDRFFIITGGPGSGKSTLIEALAALGYPHMPEAGRAIIRDQVEIGGRALPWEDRVAFAELMLGWELRSYRAAAGNVGPVLFDRGVPDVIGYLRLIGAEVPAHMKRAAELFRYRRQVFIAPPWPEIFVQDAERKQTLAEAEATYDALVGVYGDYDYELIELPRVPLRQRVDFVRERIGAAR
jgi:predicted ATPase